jgi:hypothetical protein
VRLKDYVPVEPATFRLLAQCLNQLRYSPPHLTEDNIVPTEMVRLLGENGEKPLARSVSPVSTPWTRECLKTQEVKRSRDYDVITFSLPASEIIRQI